jgi:hypothetical protein
MTFRLWDYGRRDIHGNLRELHLNQGLSAINWEAMGRAFEVPGDHLDTAFYSMQKLNEGEIELGAFELAFVQARQRCYFSDADGGILLAGGETWLVRINNGGRPRNKILAGFHGNQTKAVYGPSRRGHNAAENRRQIRNSHRA